MSGEARKWHLYLDRKKHAPPFANSKLFSIQADKATSAHSALSQELIHRNWVLPCPTAVPLKF